MWLLVKHVSLGKAFSRIFPDLCFCLLGIVFSISWWGRAVLIGSERRAGMLSGEQRIWGEVRLWGRGEALGALAPKLMELQSRSMRDESSHVIITPR